MTTMAAKVEELGRSALELHDNLDILRQATGHHATALLVLRRIAAEILRQHPTDLSFLREELKELPPEVAAFAVATLDTIEADANRPI